jgi:hypothetical protein
MSKYEFEKGKGLGKNEDGASQTISYVKNNKKTALGAKGGLVNLTTPSARELVKHKGQVISSLSREAQHVMTVPKLLHLH